VLLRDSHHRELHHSGWSCGRSTAHPNSPRPSGRIRNRNQSATPPTTSRTNTPHNPSPLDRTDWRLACIPHWEGEVCGSSWFCRAPLSTLGSGSGQAVAIGTRQASYSPTRRQRQREVQDHPISGAGEPHREQRHRHQGNHTSSDEDGEAYNADAAIPRPERQRRHPRQQAQ
jgi:hypothetical protein